MNILYIVLTCEKYWTERCPTLLGTWAKRIAQGDRLLFLSAKAEPGQGKLGFDTSDDYKSAPGKYREFIKHSKDVFSSYDWVFFCDDDTYVFPPKLRAELQLHDADTPICVGRQGVFSQPSKIFRPGRTFDFVSGGAGFAVSRKSMELLWGLIVHEKSKDHNYIYGDVTFGHWFRELGIALIDRADILRAQNPRHAENKDCDPHRMISYHYCNDSDFAALEIIAEISD